MRDYLHTRQLCFNSMTNSTILISLIFLQACLLSTSTSLFIDQSMYITYPSGLLHLSFRLVYPISSYSSHNIHFILIVPSFSIPLCLFHHIHRIFLSSYFFHLTQYISYLMNFPRPNSFYWLNQNATLLIIFLLQTRIYTSSSNFHCLILSFMYFFIHLLYLLCILMYLWNICNLYLLIKSYVSNILIWISRVKFFINLPLLLFVTYLFIYGLFYWIFGREITSVFNSSSGPVQALVSNWLAIMTWLLVGRLWG